MSDPPRTTIIHGVGGYSGPGCLEIKALKGQTQGQLGFRVWGPHPQMHNFFRTWLWRESSYVAKEVHFNSSIQKELAEALRCGRQNDSRPLESYRGERGGLPQQCMGRKRTPVLVPEGLDLNPSALPLTRNSLEQLNH